MSDFQFIRLATKPTAQICFSFSHSTLAPKPSLLVFLNGLGLPQAGWTQVIAKLRKLREESSLPSILTYDRFGQGQTTDRDPLDEAAADKSHGHDCMSVIKDLRQLPLQIASDRMGVSDLDSVPIVFVANSIGCANARLYAQEYPGTVASMLLLDSVLANSDFVSIFPDPDDDQFDLSTLPAGATPEDLRTSRAQIGSLFHPSIGNKEGLSRKNLALLLPASDAPALKGPGMRGPFVTVVGHDFEVFAKEMARTGHSKLVTHAYMNSYWHAYNEGLVNITEKERAKGPLQAPNAGHFVQRDNPDFVAQELIELLFKAL